MQSLWKRVRREKASIIIITTTFVIADRSLNHVRDDGYVAMDTLSDVIHDEQTRHEWRRSDRCTCPLESTFATLILSLIETNVENETGRGGRRGGRAKRTMRAWRWRSPRTSRYGYLLTAALPSSATHHPAEARRVDVSAIRWFPRRRRKRRWLRTINTVGVRCGRRSSLWFCSPPLPGFCRRWRERGRERGRAQRDPRRSVQPMARGRRWRRRRWRGSTSCWRASGKLEGRVPWAAASSRRAPRRRLRRGRRCSSGKTSSARRLPAVGKTSPPPRLAPLPAVGERRRRERKTTAPVWTSGSRCSTRTLGALSGLNMGNGRSSIVVRSRSPLLHAEVSCIRRRGH